MRRNGSGDERCKEERPFFHHQKSGNKVLSVEVPNVCEAQLLCAGWTSLLKIPITAFIRTNSHMVAHVMKTGSSLLPG